MPGPSAGYFQASSPYRSSTLEEKDKSIEELAQHFVLRSEIEAEIAKQLQLFVGQAWVPGQEIRYPQTQEAGPDISHIKLHREAETLPEEQLEQLHDSDPQGGRAELRPETTRQGTNGRFSKRTRLSAIGGQGGSSVTEYRLQESVWDAAVFIGLPGIGFFGSMLTALALLANITMQVMCILVINANLVGQTFADDLKGLEAWRNQVGHDLKFVSSRHEFSLVDRVCNRDPTLELATNQVNQLDMVEEYLPADTEVLHGPTMCILAVAIWCLCCLRETFATLNALRGVAQLPSAWGVNVQSMLCDGEDGGLVLHQIHPVRKAVIMLAAATRLPLVGVLFLVGILFLVRTVSISELILNAVALELVMNIDELIFSAVIPLRVAALMRSVVPLPMRRWPEYRGADVRAVIAPLCLIACLALTWFGALKETIDHIEKVKETLCDGNTTFGFEKDGLGIVRIRGLQSFDKGLALANEDLASRAVRDVSHPPAGTNFSWPWQFGLPERLPSFLPDVIVKDMDQTDLRLMMETVQDMNTGLTTVGCLDADANAPFWAVVQKYLSQTTLGVTGPIANCSQVQRYCSIAPGQRLQDIVLLRALCPVTCGCNSLLSGTAIAAPELGCPPGCLETLVELERQATACEDLNVSDPDDARAEAMRSFLLQLQPFVIELLGGQDLMQLMERAGCGFIDYFRGMPPIAYVDLCASFGGNNYAKFGDGNPLDGKTPKLFTLLCPKTCNCDGGVVGRARPEEKFCPSSCSSTAIAAAR